MLQTLRHRLRRYRALILLAIACATLLQPMLALACDIHDAQHLAATGHAHDDAAHDDGASSDTPAPDERGELARVLHLGHCCLHGHALSSAFDGLVAVSGSMAPLRVGAENPAASHPSRLLRPPIG